MNSPVHQGFSGYIQYNTLEEGENAKKMVLGFLKLVCHMW